MRQKSRPKRRDSIPVGTTFLFLIPNFLFLISIFTSSFLIPNFLFLISMPDILHRVGIKSTQNKVYEALTSIEGLSGWWTKDTKGESNKLGGLVQFRFGQNGFDMKVI